MSQLTITDGATRELLERMIADRQLSALDAQAFAKSGGAATEDAVLLWLAKEYDVPFTALEAVEPDRQVLSLFPARVLLKEQLLPLKRGENGAVEIATSRLFATQGLDALKAMTGLSLKPVLAPTEAIGREMKKHLGVGADTIGTLNEEAGLEVVQEGSGDDTDLDSAAEDASIIRFVNQVLRDAIELRASDVHLEPFEDEFRIRYRIDGELQEVPVPPALKRFQPAIVSRVKILSHLNIAEKRLPQDGRIKIRVDTHEVDIRVSIIPMLHGEAVVMRLLRQNSKLRGMGDLGMGPRELECFRRVVQLPHGIVLVTGPTGSGKTSTLYTALNEINDHIRKIITIEDPVEYQLKGVNQIQVNEKAGLTFARGLRSILRHDPDVCLIGEIRDQETAQIAVQASLTGHFVLSTLHTNDAPATLTRLLNMGVPAYNIAASVNLIVAQRLVRKICDACKHPAVPDPEVLAESAIDPALLTGKTLYEGTGCIECGGTGFKGRMAICELLDLTDHIREIILDRRPISEVKRAAKEQGMRLLRESAVERVIEGLTTLREINKVTFVE